VPASAASASSSRNRASARDKLVPKVGHSLRECPILRRVALASSLPCRFAFSITAPRCQNHDSYTPNKKPRPRQPGFRRF
jgi:hypothetical protein